MKPFSAASVGCPICQVAAWEPCVHPRGRKRCKIHDQRITHARAVHRYGERANKTRDDDFDLIED